MTNKRIARLLKETGSLIELTGGNEFRARAFANAARTLERTPEPVVDIIERGELTQVRGIGRGLADQIIELVETGTFALRDELIGSIPPGVLEILRLKGIGAKKARTIWKDLNITSITELEEAANIGRVAELPGFGPKSQESVLKAIHAYHKYSSVRRYAGVVIEVTPILEKLRETPGVLRAEFSGDLRRKMETVTSADILCTGDPETIAPALEAALDVEADIENDVITLTKKLPDGLSLNVKAVPPAKFGSVWWEDTGSEAHLARVREHFGDVDDAADEDDVFERFGIAFIAPELREGDDELEAALDVEADIENDVITLTKKLPDGLSLNVKAVPPAKFGSVWWEDTGSEAHLARVREHFGDVDDAADEDDVFERFGIAFIAPELREGDDELEAAETGTLPDLLDLDDLRGSIHNHSTYSDGAHSLREMAEAARAMGLEYFGIADHSRSLVIANGLSIERVEEQHEEIKALNAEFADGGSAFRIFAGIESDILIDGALDYPDEVLASFDYVVASVHSGFNMTKEEATARIITAVENPYTSVLGHMTGRLLLTRDGYPVDHLRIIEACAANNVSIELNANPHRLDMDWRWIREATERGVLISINPDAHSIDELHNVRWGVAAARKGWLTADQCLNAMDINRFSAWLASRRGD